MRKKPSFKTNFNLQCINWQTCTLSLCNEFRSRGLELAAHRLIIEETLMQHRLRLHDEFQSLFNLASSGTIKRNPINEAAATVAPHAAPSF